MGLGLSAQLMSCVRTPIDTSRSLAATAVDERGLVLPMLSEAGCGDGRYGSTTSLEIVDGGFRACPGVDSTQLGDWSPTEAGRK